MNIFDYNNDEDYKLIVKTKDITRAISNLIVDIINDLGILFIYCWEFDKTNCYVHKPKEDEDNLIINPLKNGVFTYRYKSEELYDHVIYLPKNVDNLILIKILHYIKFILWFEQLKEIREQFPMDYKLCERQFIKYYALHNKYYGQPFWKSLCKNMDIDNINRKINKLIDFSNNDKSYDKLRYLI